jgi:hypothetical protein
MAETTESNRGRKKKAEKDKIKALPVYAKKKNHSKILKQITPIIKELDQ